MAVSGVNLPGDGYSPMRHCDGSALEVALQQILKGSQGQSLFLGFVNIIGHDSLLSSPSISRKISSKDKPLPSQV